MKPAFKLRGEKVSLAIVDDSIFDLADRWFAAPDIAFSLASSYRNMMTVSAREYYEPRIREGQRFFTIYDNRSEKPVGLIWLFEIEEVNRHAAVGICIGETEYRGEGRGTEAMNLMLDFAFNAMNLHSIHLWAIETNERAIKSYEKCGFRYAGRRREALTIHGKVFDYVYMDILESEFKGKSYLKKLYYD